MSDEAQEEQKDIFGHLQAAAKELIAAGRGILDAADEVISDRLRLLNTFMADPAAKSAKPADAPKVEKIEVDREES